MIGPFDLNRVHCGDAVEMLRRLPDECVQVCVTSPPYWGLRDYGVNGQLGLESTPQDYVACMTTVFEEVRRVLRKDGTLWLNSGDSYASNASGTGIKKIPPGLKPKDLCGIPWRLALSMQAAGWYLRCDIIWSKPNSMPESVTDRPTKSHEYLFLFAKSERYYYDAEAIRETPKYIDTTSIPRKLYKDARSYGGKNSEKQRGHSRRHAGFNDRWDKMTKAEQQARGRNKHSVWEIATEPYSGAHFATYPTEIVKPCILSGSKPGDIVLDPFAGSGTTGIVAIKHSRKFIGFDLNKKYCAELATPRLAAAERGQMVEQYKSGQLVFWEGGD